MANKRQKQLLDQAKTKVRKPDPSRLEQDLPKQRGRGRPKQAVSYKPVPLSFLPSEISWVDQLATTLKKGGIYQANRSWVVRKAISELKDRLKSKSDKEVVSDFSKHQDNQAE